MRLTSLDVRSVRNLTEVTLQPEAGLNILFGDNGAGKTSLLEAISILSTGKTFRSGKISTVIQSDCDALTINGSILNDRNDTTTTVGISRDKDKTIARINGSNVQKLSELALALPCVVISAKNHELIEGGPSERRSFMDWILFHVEHDYLNQSRRYKNALNQRNAALRSGAPDSLVSSWDKELTTAGENINSSRSLILQKFDNHFKRLAAELDEEICPEFKYRRGWPEEYSLAATLKKNIANCRRIGATSSGPHRADLKIKIGVNEARYINSRGQQKLLAILMKLAQVDIYREHHQHPPVVLFDDLPSELDENARQFVFEYLQQTKVQVFLTSVDDITNEIHNVSNKFHVERGHIKKMVY